MAFDHSDAHHPFSYGTAAFQLERPVTEVCQFDTFMKLMSEQDDVVWRGFQAQLLQCWVGEAIAHVIERFSSVSSGSSSVALLSNGHQEEDAAAFGNITTFVKQFLVIQHSRRSGDSGGEASAGSGGGGGGDEELCVAGVGDTNELTLWLQSHHEELTPQDHSDTPRLVILYAPLLPLETQEEIVQIVTSTKLYTRTLLLLIHDPIGLMGVSSADSSSISSPCYRLIDSHAQPTINQPSPSSSLPASLSSYEHFLVYPLKQLGVQCGLRFVMEIARWTVFNSSADPRASDAAVVTTSSRPLMLASVAQMPFQLLLLALRWSHFHPTLVRAFAKPFERKLRLIPQNRIRNAIFQLREQEMALWGHLNAAEEPRGHQLMSPPARRLPTEAELAPLVQIPTHNENEMDTDLKRRSLAQCHLWDVQKQFYLAQGIRAWSDGIIPFGVSSSSFLAAAYARTSSFLGASHCIA